MLLQRWKQHVKAVLNLPQVLLLGLTLLVSGVDDTISSIRNVIAEQLQSWAAAIAAHSTTGNAQRVHGRATAEQHSSSTADRRPPGFVRQFGLVLGRAALMRTREPFLVFIEYMIFAVTGALDRPAAAWPMAMNCQTHYHQSCSQAVCMQSAAAVRSNSSMQVQHGMHLGKQWLRDSLKTSLCAAAYAGMFVGLMSDRGRGSIGSYVGNVVYSIVAMGMLSTVKSRRGLLQSFSAVRAHSYKAMSYSLIHCMPVAPG